jgi:hypothetical protein
MDFDSGARGLWMHCKLGVIIPCPVCLWVLATGQPTRKKSCISVQGYYHFCSCLAAESQWWLFCFPGEVVLCQWMSENCPMNTLWALEFTLSMVATNFSPTTTSTLTHFLPLFLLSCPEFYYLPSPSHPFSSFLFFPIFTVLGYPGLMIC